MQIELVLNIERVEVIFTNTSSTELHLWEPSNSWGWSSISFEIKSGPNSKASTIMHLWNAEFTKNAPSTLTLAAGEKRGFIFDLNDGWWMRDHTIAHLKDKPLFVRVSYHVDPLSAAEVSALTERNPDLVSHYEHIAPFTNFTVDELVSRELERM